MLPPVPFQDELQKAFKEVSFTKDQLQEFAALWQLREFKRNAFITEAGKIERHFYLVLDGVQTLYCIDKRGEKVILGFTYRGDFSGGYYSFLTRRPAQFFLEALIESRMLAIDFDNFHRLYDWHPDFERWGRLFNQRILIGRGEREVELLTLSAEERYVSFMRRFPPELLQIPQKYLASYLNMTPETFSRLRAKVRL